MQNSVFSCWNPVYLLSSFNAINEVFLLSGDLMLLNGLFYKSLTFTIYPSGLSLAWHIQKLKPKSLRLCELQFFEVASCDQSATISSAHRHQIWPCLVLWKAHTDSIGLLYLISGSCFMPATWHLGDNRSISLDSLIGWFFQYYCTHSEMVQDSSEMLHIRNQEVPCQ